MSAVGREQRVTGRFVVGSVLAATVAVAVHLAAQVGMLVTRPDWSISAFRGYFPFDQLSYLSMVTNAANGDPSFTEPFSRTGANNYPHAWYLVLGAVSRVFDVSSATAWQVGGLFMQALLVAALGIALVVLSRSPWTALLAPVPFLLGTFTFLRTGGWYTSMESHAVLWGPFGVLFTLNGEAASLCFASIALLGLLLVWARPTRPATRLVVTLSASALIGALANVQTYSFITAVYVACFVTSAWALLHHRRRVAAVLAVVLVPVLFLLGPVVEDRAGQLPALVFGLLPAAPGLLVVLREHGPRLLLYFGAAVLTAAPQVVSTVGGILSGDPFLAYRVASNRSLGVEPGVGLLSSLPLLLPLALLLGIGLWRRRGLWAAFAVGASAAWGVLATNDRWGANAEPYRLWIDSVLLIAVTALPLLVEAVAATVRRGARASRTSGARPPRVGRVVVGAALAVVIASTAVSALDWARFYADNRTVPLFALGGAYAQALANSADDAIDGEGRLVAQAPCIDPQLVKAGSPAPVAFYNLGLAWPERRDEVDDYLAARAEGTVDADTLRSADIGWVMTDTACADGWDQQLAGDAEPVSSHDYETGSIRLWRVE